VYFLKFIQIVDFSLILVKCSLLSYSQLQDVPEFELHFDKVYKWVASSVAEKNAFILSLWKVV